LIKAGRVELNGHTVFEPYIRAIWGTDDIKVDGRTIPAPSGRIYVMLNKPFGYICSLNDPQGRALASDLLKEVKDRVYPVGRLDFDSLGLLLFTNDGEWAYRLSHPRYRVPKTYKVTVDGPIPHETLDALRKGVHLEDGFSGPSRITILQSGMNKGIVRLTITSGRTRLVRRMMRAVGLNVIHLIRIGVGPLELGALKVGRYRHLEDHEVEACKKMVGLP
jgi:pseudouridine synthase